MPVTIIATAVNFYEDKLGFVCDYQDAGFGKLTRDEIEIHLWAANDLSWKNRGINLVAVPISTGAESFLAGTASCRIGVEGIEDLFLEYQKKGVLYNAHTRIEKTSWHTLEFPALDLHRNLLTFFQAT